MVKPECRNQFEKILGIRDDFESLITDIQNFRGTSPEMVTKLAEIRKNYISDLRLENDLTTDEELKFRGWMTEMINAMKKGKEISDIIGIGHASKYKVLKVALDKFAECECGEFLVKVK